LTGLDGDELVFDNVFMGASDNTQTLTLGSGQTQQWTGWISNTRASASTEQATGSSVTMNWTAASTGRWAIAAVPINPAPSGTQYTITATAGANGSINPSGAVNVSQGNTQSFTITPNSGYQIADVLVDGGSIGAQSNYQFPNVQANHTIAASFEVAVGGALTLDGSVSSNTADANNSSISITHTTGTGTNRLMLVGISWNCGTTNRTISSVTFTPNGGSATGLTEVITQLGYNSSNPRYSAIYYLLNPPSGQLGTVTINFSGSVTNGIVAGVANFAGVDQTTPLGTPNGAGTDAQDDAPGVTLTGLDGDELVFDNVFMGASDNTQTLTLGSGQTQQWTGWISNTRASASTEQATGSSVTMSWTAASTGRWAIAAVPINPAFVNVNAKIFLEGPYAGSSTMNTSLTVPTTDPYGEGVTVGGIPSGVVDWVKLELRKESTPGVVAATRAAFLKSDGSIVDLDGTSPVKMYGVTNGNYFIAVKQRNHVAVMSHDAQALSSSTSTLYDFTTGSNKFYGEDVGAKDLGSGVWGMMAGDGNGNGQVQNDDSENIWKPDNGTSGYKNSDFNMNGQVQNDDNENYWKPNNGKGTQVP